MREVGRPRALLAPRPNIPCRSAPCARPSNEAVHPSAAVAHKVRSYKGIPRPVPTRSLWERTLCATNLRSGTPKRGDRAQGALLQGDMHARGRTKADAQRGHALSPQRFGRVAQRLEVSPVYPRRLSHDGVPRAFGLIQTRCCGRFRPFSLGYFSFGPAKEK